MESLALLVTGLLAGALVAGVGPMIVAWRARTRRVLTTAMGVAFMQLFYVWVALVGARPAIRVTLTIPAVAALIISMRKLRR